MKERLKAFLRESFAADVKQNFGFTGQVISNVEGDGEQNAEVVIDAVCDNIDLFFMQEECAS